MLAAKGVDLEKSAADPRPDDAAPPVRRPWKWTHLLNVLVWSWVSWLLWNSNVATRRAAAEYARDHAWTVSTFASRPKAISPQEAEKLYLTIPNPDSALQISRSYATHPHMAGSSEDFADARTILALFQEHFGIPQPEIDPVFPAGSDASRSAILDIPTLARPIAWIDEYYPVMNTPLDRSLSVLHTNGSVAWEADIEEDGDPLDPDAARFKDAVPVFHGLSADGEAEGELIYVNYGLKEDYDEVLANGGNFTGKIVLARYGGNFRGLKIKGAEELGAVGILIYTDLRDDGVVTEENGYAPYPAGPARNPTSVQRGSVQYISMYPGDPTTPGAPAYKNATRTEGTNIPRIPSLPISWANAQTLLKLISDESFEDATKLNGKTSSQMVRLVNHVDTKVMPIWNTMAVLPGHISSETVVVGCHRDAWVMGAADPTSGTVSVHEFVRGIGALLKNGWRPLRNIVFASWDAEEFGLIGSVEWAEDFPEWLSENVVAYINLDVSSIGSQWTAQASPLLAHLIRDAALDVPHPNTPGKTLWDARLDSGPFSGAMDATFSKAYNASQAAVRALDMGITPLGSGSDFTPFLQRLGIPSMNQDFDLTPYDAPYHYHSIYDSQRWQELYGDPGFVRHVAVAKHLGLLVLRLADALVLPLNTTHYTLELRRYLDEIEAMSSEPDFAPLRASFHKLHRASLALDKEKDDAEKTLRRLLDRLPRPGDGDDDSGRWAWLCKVLRWLRTGGRERGFPMRELAKAAKRVQAANARLIAFERGFIHPEGIKEREWYRHLGVAPGKWLGYGATTLPSITEALTIDGSVEGAEKEAARVAELVDKLVEVLKLDA